MLRYVILSVFLAMLVCALCACTGSATQLEHWHESQERQREADLDHVHLEDRVIHLEDQVTALEKRVEALEAK